MSLIFFSPYGNRFFFRSLLYFDPVTLTSVHPRDIAGSSNYSSRNLISVDQAFDQAFHEMQCKRFYVVLCVCMYVCMYVNLFSSTIKIEAVLMSCFVYVFMCIYVYAICVCI